MGVEPAKILVVDDNRLNRMKLSRGLEVLGHAALLADDGVLALETLASQPVDLVLLDIMMPGMDGFEVLKHIRAEPRYQDIGIIMISALDEMEGIIHCLQQGADDYLLKPFEATLLKVRVNHCLERQQLRRALATLGKAH